MRLSLAAFAMITTLLAAPAGWSEVANKLTPGQRVEIHHKSRIDRGLYAFSNANEIVITRPGNGFLSISQAEVDRVVKKGVESPNLNYFSNARDQLFPRPEVVYERRP